MNMREARLLISRAYSTRDPEEMAEAHRAACHATIDDDAEAAALVVVVQAQLRGLAAIAGEAGEENVDNMAAALATLFAFLDTGPGTRH